MIPNTRFALATMAFPVPRSLVGNNSGDTAYNTPYITLLVKLYPQFHPSSAFDVRAVVDARMKIPVRTWSNSVNTSHASGLGWHILVNIERVPRRPRNGNSTQYPAMRAPGIPITLRMICWYSSQYFDKSMKTGTPTLRYVIYTELSPKFAPLLWRLVGVYQARYTSEENGDVTY